MPTDDERYMELALNVARKGKRQAGSNGIGCIIVLGGTIVGEAHNEVGLQHDPTAHAEVVAIRRACHALGRDDLRGATLYSTLQPCGMCSMASIWASIGRVVYGATRSDVHQMYFEDRDIDVDDIIKNAFRDDMVAVGGLMAGECAALCYSPEDNPPGDEQANV